MDERWWDKHKGGPEEHTDRCYCGRKATKHVRWLWGCGNVCGVHARSMARRQPGRKMEVEDIRSA